MIGILFNSGYRFEMERPELWGIVAARYVGISVSPVVEQVCYLLIYIGSRCNVCPNSVIFLALLCCML